MASGKITNKTKLSGSISSGNNLTSAAITSGSGTTDHSRLTNRAELDQHPIEAITGLRSELDSKLNSTTALPLIDEALQGKAKGLYFDALKELARKSYWYLTSEIDPKTGLGTKNSIISGPYDLGMGGGSGGGGGVTTVSVKQVNWPAAASVGNSDVPTKITVTWSSVIGEDRTPTGDGTLYLTVNGKVVETRAKQRQGEVEFDISRHLVSGDNNVQVKVLDMYGTTGVTVGIINGVSLKLTSNFDSSLAFYNKIDYTYTPVGNVDKKVFFEVDGEPYGDQIVKSSNELITYTISGLSHGAHTLRVYFEAVISGQAIQSNELFYDLTFVQAGNSIPIIASDFNAFKQEQYISFKIPYRVFIDNKNMAQVTLKANGEIIRTSEVTTNGVHVWTYRADEPYSDADPLVLEIICGTIVKRFEITVKESAITITPTTENLELALSALGRSNDEFPEQREVWSYTNTTELEPITYNSTFKNFNWSSDGWVLDENDINVLRVGGQARVEIPFEVFAKDFVTRGKTIELEIATRGIRNYDTTIISCLDKVKSPFYEVEEFYEEEETRLKGYEVAYTYSILKSAITTEGKHLFTYDGTSWTLNGNKVNLSDYGITLSETLLNVEGDDIGTVVKGDRILVNFSMEARGFEVTPQVASIRSQQSLLSTQYKEDEHIRIAFVVEPNTADKNRIIWMYINGVASGAMQYPSDDTFKQESPSYITIGSSEAIVDIYNIRIYNSALTNKQVVNNWIADTADAADKAYRFNHNNVLNEQDQLTPESMLVGAPDLPYMIWDIDPLPEFKGDKRLGNGRYVDPMDSTRNFTVEDGEYNVQGTSSSVYPTKNIRLRNRSKNGAGYAWYDDNGDTIKEWPITYPGGIGVNYYTFKVDYASSEGANNVELTKLYNDASIKYGLLTPPQRQNGAVRVGIDGFPIVAFHKNAAEEITFHTKANFNNDKANEDVYGFADGDESWETTNNSAAETKYQIPVTVDNFDRGFEIRFPDEDGYNDMSKLGPMTAWVHSTYRAEATNAELDKPVTFTYEESVQSEGGSFSTTTVTKEFTHDTAEYRLAKFKTELKDWFNVDSCLFYYLYTELFLMIDSRAKNAFPTYFATRTKELVKDDKGKEIPNTYTDGGNRWYWIPYDMDTAIGIDNKGKLTFDYYLEDIDQLDGADVYNGQSSVMWCNVRDAFKGELAAMYAALRNQRLISFEEVETRFEDHQHKWPEVVLNLDAHNKYIVPLKNGDNYLEMLQGTKEQQRKWWLYNRFKYIDSKYNGGEAVKDFIQFRAYVDIGEEKPNLTITPYANIYATASFGNGAQYVVSQRVKNRNEAITLKNPFGLADDENDQETYIYSASQLKSIGDISGFHPDTVKIGNAIRLQDLKVGDASPTYANPYLKELTVGANTLLKTIDARNCTNLGTGTTVAPDLSQCTNIEEIYFTGTKIKGIVLPDGGTIKKVHLPGTLTSLTIRNQPLLEDLYIENTNTTITKSADKTGGYSFRGLVVKKDEWNTTSANANLYLADSLDEAAPQLRVSIADKDLYDTIIETESILQIACTYIDARFDLIEDTDIELVEYSTRFINQSVLDTGTPTITLLLAEIEATITPPALEEFKTSLIERLWLEGIPSEAIQAKEFIKNMKAGTEVRLININETYSSWEEIKEFYDLLDRHYGINFNDSPTRPKAQVTGIINIDTISYKNYIELTTRYPEVTINAKQIICTVTFYNVGQECTTTNIALSTSLDAANKLSIIGKPVEAPADPTRDETQAYYYIFSHWEAKKATYSEETSWGYESTGELWTPEYLAVSDTRIDAVYEDHLQRYSVTFDTDSDLISIDADHRDLVVEYGSTITAPETINVPTAVELDGWYLPNGEKWVFEGESASQVLDHITLKAKWIDENEPSVSVARQTYNTFSYEAFDNLGIVKWAVVKDTAEAPTSWNTIKSTTHLVGTYEISSAGEYYFWISDANGNTAMASLVAYAISVTTTPGITPAHYVFTEGESTFSTSFAISGAILRLVVTPDEHYENLSVDISTALADSLDTFIVSQAVEIALACTPKDYVVTFVTGKEADGARVPSQTITYLHKPEQPLALYHAGYIVNAWYKEPELINLWDFETDIVEGPTSIYAEWWEYRTPTKIKIKIPFDLAEVEDEDVGLDPYTISVNYTQNKANTVKVQFGDGTGEFSTASTTYTTTIEHTYTEPGEYIVEIYGTPFGFGLGGSFSKQTVDPACCIKDIDFAWDVATTKDYAFKGAQIEELKLTPYMTSIATAAFAVCNKLKTVDFPSSIYRIGSQAFENCSGLVGDIVIPKTVAEVGNNVFANCANIEQIVFEDGGILQEIGSQFANNSGIKKLVIPSYINYIKSEAFGNCGKLEKVVMLNPDLTMGERVFNSTVRLASAGPIDWGAGLGKSNYNIEYAWSKKIPDYAFSAGTNFRQSYLTSVALPDDLEEIGYAAFRGSGIKQITLPPELKIIGEEAFYYTALLELDVPASVKSVGARAFGYNNSFNSVNLYFKGSLITVDAPTDGWFFECDPSLVLKIPASLVHNPIDLVVQYGPYWNVCAYDYETGETQKLLYSGIAGS
jgi:hypothetical protein